jgi:predicted regulator of amino acid metabolism with ACT domain
MSEGKGPGLRGGDISTLVFRRVMRQDAGEISFDPQMLATFMELDGKKNLAGVAKKTGQKMSSVREAVSKLLQLKLIEPVTRAISIVDIEFISFFQKELSLAIGPLAQIVIEDAASDLGHDLSRFPSHRAAELVELTGREIKREEKRAVFTQNMVRMIKEKGY